VSADSIPIVWLFISAGLALVVILLALGVALVVYQRRFLAMHRSYAEGLLGAQEAERAWVAREVHDDALQRIMLIHHELDGWAERQARTPEERDKRLGALRGELEELSAVLRRMAYRLHPVYVEQESIAGLLKRLAADMDHAGGLHVEVRDRLTNDLRLGPDQSLAVYRIAQEALTNVVKHARSPKATIEVWRTGHQLEMKVEDHGAGFAVNGNRPHGLGLTSMAERARSAGGILSVESYPDGGTRVHLRLPVGEAK
jgi:two-component system sensor histidine kinase UhpB